MAQLFTTAVGHGFAGLFSAIKRVRPERPIHSRGLRLTGAVEVAPPGTASGIAWIDTPGTSTVAARISRSVGLPDGLPDVVGLAFRINDWPDAADAGLPADVLLSSTGWSRAGRFVLLPRFRADRSPLTTIIPYRGPHGPVLIGARTLGPAPLPASLGAFGRTLGGEAWVLGLYHARPRGPWHQFGTMSLLLDLQGKEDLRFDAVLNPLPGADTYGWTKRLREPSYAVARRPPPR
ncbi:hypothetical protein [Arthrobacter sp. Br18]|uniref:hypothetical protein n=1 Tax=Arthrobacter sp. Br18 TaxID=1312954 RepID=UPI00047E0945|nr:hypothetical protein [Arthrobacter sp. Br18]